MVNVVREFPNQLIDDKGSSLATVNLLLAMIKMMMMMMMMVK